MNGDVVKAFGLVIRRLRSASGLSQEAFAEEASLNRSFLSQLETGAKQPSLLTVFRLAAALHLEASDLIRQVEKQVGESAK